MLEPKLQNTELQPDKLEETSHHGRMEEEEVVIELHAGHWARAMQGFWVLLHLAGRRALNLLGSPLVFRMKL